VVVEDACRAIDLNGSLDAARQSFASRDISRIAADALAG
jgi:hypothetical protein